MDEIKCISDITNNDSDYGFLIFQHEDRGINSHFYVQNTSFGDTDDQFQFVSVFSYSDPWLVENNPTPTSMSFYLQEVCSVQECLFGARLMGVTFFSVLPSRCDGHVPESASELLQL